MHSSTFPSGWFLITDFSLENFDRTLEYLFCVESQPKLLRFIPFVFYQTVQPIEILLVFKAADLDSIHKILYVNFARSE